MNAVDRMIICFGELLWDMLPQGKQAGGAPMNVAFHLNRLGCHAVPLTAVGKDNLGVELLEFLIKKNIPVQWIQKNEYPTGRVNVDLNEKNEARYTIEAPSAWDFIQIQTEEIDLIKSKEPILVYGSLACRHAISHTTLETLLPLASLKICDINLRAPFYNQELVTRLLSSADWIKINHEELHLISDWFKDQPGDETDQAKLIMTQFPNADKLLITRGDKGAAYYNRLGEKFEHPGYNVEVVDTIGSGDSFLAMFIARHLTGFDPARCLADACAMGSVVAQHQGATAIFDIEKEINQLKNRPI